MHIPFILSNEFPNAYWRLEGDDSNYEGLCWGEQVWLNPVENHPAKPTKAKLEKIWFDKYSALFAEEKVRKQRKPEYPSLEEFAEAYYFEKKGDSSKMEAYIVNCDKVKAKYPMPT